MKRILFTVLCTCALCLMRSSAYSWICIDNSRAPYIPISGILTVVSKLDNTITKNFKNYPAAFALSNVGGYPMGDAYLGNFPHMFFGVSGTVGCANMKYFDENIMRDQYVYPALAPNFDLYFGFGLAKGFDFMFKAMVFYSTMYRPPLNEDSANLKKLNIYSAGVKLRKNLINKIEILPHIFNFGGLTISAGADYMEGIFGINGTYNYDLGTLYVNPPGASFNVDFNTIYNFNLKWIMTSVNAQALAYINFLWIFDLYAGFGFALTYGYTSLDGSGMGILTSSTLLDLGQLFACVQYKSRPRCFMGLFICGFEINLWILKITAETMVNITNGRDINLQLGTRFQF